LNRAHRIEMLVRAADAGSFAKAAHSLGLTASAVSRAIAQLERELRVALFYRTTRSLKLTDDGEELYRRGRELLEKLDEIEAAVSRTPDRLGGTLRVGLSVPLNRHIIMPAVVTFMRRHPGLRLQCFTLTQPKEMHAQGVDVLLRVGDPPDSDLIARKLAALRFVLCASPEYLKSAGPLRQPDDLLRHRCLVHQPPHEPKPFDRWEFEKVGMRKVMQVTPALFTNDREGMITAGVNGAGVMRIGMFDPALIATGRLQRVMTDWRCVGGKEIYALYRKAARSSPKVAAFVEFAGAALSAFDPEELTVIHHRSATR
jgi:DNA-binding transcriptional LysR family regulator